MSIRIALDNPPEFYTNLDFIQGRIILGLNRSENVGNIIVKLEGESRTALALPRGDFENQPVSSVTSGDVVTENHKLLYLVQQVYPGGESGFASAAIGSMPGVLHPGQHEFRFRFKVPLNNICSNPKAMAALSGVGGLGAMSPGNGGLFGGYRIMDGSKQLMLRHVKTTLPPSLTGFPRQAEIRYYIKVTIQRPGFFKENWRYQTGFKFLPIEPPRPPKTSQEAFARRPFIFKPRTPLPQRKKKNNPFFSSKSSQAEEDVETVPPSIEISARLPHPTILTCNEPIPLRLIAKKIANSQEQVYLSSLEIALVGFTNIRVHDLQNTEVSRWLVCTTANLSIALGSPQDAVDSEFVVPDALWANIRMPNTVAPSFTGCNISRRYELEMKVGLSWGLPSTSGKATAPYPQLIYLPLKLSKVEIYSGITPPRELLRSSTYRPQQSPPTLPPRTSVAPSRPQAQPQVQPSDPLYPPQLGPNSTPYEDAPPSYDEAIAQDLTGPSERPAYSGVTAENDPSTMPPEKSGLH
ncbi:arrestin [Pseudomassariella vexata]|uniref:Arrestin n=1 Tax=Pseudomassariella vexata TaxID=1141098 RepID=A0A1Y2DUY5_9PEZI|nr:arrestin [Pseudomassariella vexata]ORY62999.1 arrestin [Pseudomassariella vexata]